jgi:hypothetical protein
MTTKIAFEMFLMSSVRNNLDNGMTTQMKVTFSKMSALHETFSNALTNMKDICTNIAQKIMLLQKAIRLKKHQILYQERLKSTNKMHTKSVNSSLKA